MYRDRRPGAARAGSATVTRLVQPGNRQLPDLPSAVSFVGIIIEPGQPAGQQVNDGLGVRVLIHKVPQPLGQPAERYLLGAAPLVQFLDAAVGEVHGFSPSAGTPRR
jgi:hypothetical protein